MRTDKQRKYSRDWMRKWRKKHPENAKKQSLSAMKWQKKNPIRHARNEYKKRARNKNIIYEIPNDLFEKMVMNNCFYCGVSPNPINGIDRLDSSQGYFQENIVTACKQCNLAKNSTSFDDFIAWIKRLINYNLGG